MKINITKNQIFERKADKQGRVSLPAREFAGKNVEIVVTEVINDG